MLMEIIPIPKENLPILSVISHTEGLGTYASNNGEHAEGTNNLSYCGLTDKDITIHTVGNGRCAKNKSNAFQIMQNGDAYMIGIGGFDGTNYQEAMTVQQVIEKQAKLIESLMSSKH